MLHKGSSKKRGFGAKPPDLMEKKQPPLLFMEFFS
jgi:hypothetical protein